MQLNSLPKVHPIIDTSNGEKGIGQGPNFNPFLGRKFLWCVEKANKFVFRKQRQKIGLQKKLEAARKLVQEKQKRKKISNPIIKFEGM